MFLTGEVLSTIAPQETLAMNTCNKDEYRKESYIHDITER